MIRHDKLPPPHDEDGFLTHAAQNFVDYVLREFKNRPSDLPLEVRFQDLVQKPWLERVMEKHGHSKLAASKAIGLHRTTLRKRCLRLGVTK